MIPKDVWVDAISDFMASERERLGPPPTEEELARFYAGEMDGAEEERIRALIAAWCNVPAEERPS